MKPSLVPAGPVLLIAGALAMLGTLGCQADIPTAIVSGTVTDEQGEPLDSVRVVFMPNPNQQTRGPSSWGITDDAGRYELTPMTDQIAGGAVIGAHQVTMQDLGAENNRTGEAPVVRVPLFMNNAGTSGLTAVVEPGDQQIDFEIETGTATKKSRRR